MHNSGIIIAGKYELGKEIGKGGMSRVYLATDTRLNKVWAVKKVDKTSTNPNKEFFIKNLRKEVKLMEGLSYATIPRIVDVIEDTQTIYIVMDYVEGEGLDKILKIQGKQNEEDVIEWAKQICETLIYLHSLKNPVVHRDIKPANIILQPGVQNAIKILDFGIAEEITKDNSRNTHPVGTPGYMAPEQETKGIPYDIRSDIYSFGATLHHLLTGKIPKKDKPFAKLRTVTGRVSENTEGLEYVIERCLKKDPNERYQNCKELLFDLNRLPDLSKEHRRKLVNRVTTFSLVAVLSVIFAFTSLFSNMGYKALAKQDQASHAKEIYDLSNEIINDYDRNPSDFVTVLDKMQSIETKLDISKKLSNDKYTNALVFSVYSISMWNINEKIQFALPANNNLNAEEMASYNNCKKIFDHDFINHIGAFASNISECTDSKQVAICICELNAFNILFASALEDSAAGILQNTNQFIIDNNYDRDLLLETCFAESYSDFISGEGYDFFQNEISNEGLGNDLVDVLNDFANAKSAATSSLKSTKTHEPTVVEKEEALTNCLSQYAKVVDTVSNTNLNHYYKFLLYSNAANYLDHNIAVFHDNNIQEDLLTSESSLYASLDNAVTVLIDSSSDDSFISKCKNLNISGIYSNIKSTYHPTSSKNS